MCKKIINRLLVVIILMTANTVIYSQEDTTTDYVAPVTDTVVTDTDQLENYKNVEEDAYNYYDYLLYWPADSFVMRKVPDTVIAALKAKDEFWYADKDFRKKYVEPAKPNRFDLMLSTKWFNFLLWTVIIGGFAAVLIWFLVNSNVRLFRKKVTIINNGEDGLQNIFEINYNEEINKAVQSGNYRLATRLLFLRLLKNLADRQLISYKEDATNFDYLLQLSNSNYYKGFFKVTRYYEYAWYGGFEVNGDLYNAIKKDFDSLDAQMIRS